MIKEWDRSYGGRRIPPDWVRARLRWAREQTLALGHNVPSALDDMLPRLGEAPEQRPPSFLTALLADQAASEHPIDDLLIAAGAHRWHLLFDADELFRRLSEGAADKDGDRDDADKIAEIRAAAADDPNLREALSGSIADTLEDAAAELWLDGRPGEAKSALELSAALRREGEPEKLDWIPHLLRFQIAAVAMQQLMQQQQG
jgi:hypothetical protein